MPARKDHRGSSDKTARASALDLLLLLYNPTGSTLSTHNQLLPTVGNKCGKFASKKTPKRITPPKFSCQTNTTHTPFDALTRSNPAAAGWLAGRHSMCAKCTHQRAGEFFLLRCINVEGKIIPPLSSPCHGILFKQNQAFFMVDAATAWIKLLNLNVRREIAMKRARKSRRKRGSRGGKRGRRGEKRGIWPPATAFLCDFLIIGKDSFFAEVFRDEKREHDRARKYISVRREHGGSWIRSLSD